jgi:integrase/recombinase XerD
MKKMIGFHSVLAEQMQQFIVFKRMQGCDYSSQARKLSYFDRFLIDDADEEPSIGLKLDSLRRYVGTTVHLKNCSRQSRLGSLREFSRYLHARFPQSAVLPIGIIPRHAYPVRFYRIEPRQVADLMAAAQRLRPAGGIRAPSINMLIGLLYCTGLRINEALHLTLADIDYQRSVLQVVDGKFGKQRFVPMSPSTVSALTHYLDIRSHHAGTSIASPLLIGAFNKALSYDQAQGGFRQLCRDCGLCGQPPPRLHDLRHNYACRRLALWREEGCDINTMLPILATAMGHVNIYNTQIYLHIELGDLHAAAARLPNPNTPPNRRTNNDLQLSCHHLLPEPPRRRTRPVRQHHR